MEKIKIDGESQVSPAPLPQGNQRRVSQTSLRTMTGRSTRCPAPPQLGRHASALRTSGAGHSPCTVGGGAASLAPSTRCQEQPPGRDHHRRPQTPPSVPPVRTTELGALRCASGQGGGTGSPAPITLMAASFASKTVTRSHRGMLHSCV